MRQRQSSWDGYSVRLKRSSEQETLEQWVRVLLGPYLHIQIFKKFGALSHISLGLVQDRLCAWDDEWGEGGRILGAEIGSDDDEEESEEVPGIDDVLDDLSSFDVANGLTSTKKMAVKKETASHKQHKKPQRKKDRDWRVKNAEGGDGMPLVRVFQKPANTGLSLCGE